MKLIVKRRVARRRILEIGVNEESVSHAWVWREEPHNPRDLLVFSNPGMYARTVHTPFPEPMRPLKGLLKPSHYEHLKNTASGIVHSTHHYPWIAKLRKDGVNAVGAPVRAEENPFRNEVFHEAVMKDVLGDEETMRGKTLAILTETHRVLKPRGVMRIVEGHTPECVQWGVVEGFFKRHGYNAEEKPGDEVSRWYRPDARVIFARKPAGMR